MINYLHQFLLPSAEGRTGWGAEKPGQSLIHHLPQPLLI